MSMVSIVSTNTAGISDPHKPLTIRWQATQRDRRLKQFLYAQLNNGGTVGVSDGVMSTFNGPDLTFKIKNDHVTVHSLLMSVHCRNFSKWLEKHKCFSLPATVDLTSAKLSKDGLRKMVQFVYEDGKIGMDEKTAEITLIAASYFSMVELIRLLEAYSLQLVSSKIMFMPRWLEIADKNEVNPIYKNELHRLAARKFRTLSTMQEMYRLPHTVIVKLLQRDDLKTNSECNAFRLALLWLQVNKDGDGIDGKAQEILSMVRFANMTTEQGFECLNMARKVGLFDLVKPHVVMSDWPKTCLDCRHDFDTDVKPKPRIYSFEGSNREQRYPCELTNRYPQPVRKSELSTMSRSPSARRKSDETFSNVKTRRQKDKTEFIESVSKKGSDEKHWKEGKVNSECLGACLAKDAKLLNLKIEQQENETFASKIALSQPRPMLEIGIKDWEEERLDEPPDVGKPFCLHLAIRETKESNESLSRYHRLDCRLTDKACHHASQQCIVKSRH